MSSRGPLKKAGPVVTAGLRSRNSAKIGATWEAGGGRGFHETNRDFLTFQRSRRVLRPPPWPPGAMPKSKIWWGVGCGWRARGVSQTPFATPPESTWAMWRQRRNDLATRPLEQREGACKVRQRRPSRRSEGRVLAATLPGARLARGSPSAPSRPAISTGVIGATGLLHRRPPKRSLWGRTFLRRLGLVGSR